MPSVKIKDTTGGPDTRRTRIYDIGNELGIPINKVSGDHGIYYAIIAHQQMERLLSEEAKEAFSNEDYQVLDPPETNALRSVWLKEVDKQIDQYEPDEIAANIERTNDGLEVEEVIKIPTTSKLIKVRFTTISMAERVINSGIKILKQSIPTYRIEREIFVKIQHCYNCYSIEHFTNRCPKNKLVLCSKCGQEGHIKPNCRENTTKCINCGETSHETTAARCPKKKERIKTKTAEIRKGTNRERSRSRPRANTAAYSNTATYNSYAAAAQTQQTRLGIYGGASAAISAPDLGPKLPPNYMEKVASGLIWASWRDQSYPGSFQNNMNEFYKLHGLTPIQFPDMERPRISDIPQSIPQDTDLGSNQAMAMELTLQEIDDHNKRKNRSNDDEIPNERRVEEQLRMSRAMTEKYDLVSPIRDPRERKQKETPQLREIPIYASTPAEPRVERKKEKTKAAPSESMLLLAHWNMEVMYPENWNTSSKIDILGEYINNNPLVTATTEAGIPESRLRKEVRIIRDRKQIDCEAISFIPTRIEAVEKNKEKGKRKK